FAACDEVIDETAGHDKNAIFPVACGGARGSRFRWTLHIIDHKTRAIEEMAPVTEESLDTRQVGSRLQGDDEADARSVVIRMIGVKSFQIAENRRMCWPAVYVDAGRVVQFG